MDKQITVGVDIAVRVPAATLRDGTFYGYPEQRVEKQLTVQSEKAGLRVESRRAYG